MNQKAVLAIAGVFIGCCCNIVFFELIIKYGKSKLILSSTIAVF